MFIGIFRMAIAVLAIYLIGSLIFNLLGGVGSAAAGGLGLLLLIPLFFFKIALLLMFFGFISRAFWGGGRRPDRWGGYRPTWTRERSPQTESRSQKDRFEEWHDLAHAREEVDSWVPDLSGDNNVIDENGPGR